MQNQKRTLGSAEDIRQWEEARCPVYLEHPHNAVLVRCSSYDNGCRPFMCSTSSHHSNCLDQFCKSLEPSPSSFIMPGSLCGHIDNPDNESEYMLSCPFCRGCVYGWYVIQHARVFMNSKITNCSAESCEFSGNYTKLRKHARSEHPNIRPSAVDPDRLENWTMLESEDRLSDLLSVLMSTNVELDGNEEEQQGDEMQILDEMETEADSSNIQFADDNNVAMVGDILPLVTTTLFTDWPRMRSGNNFRRRYRSSRDNLTSSRNPKRNNYGRSRRNNLSPRPNDSFRGNNTRRMRRV